jgi:hypothetical protein
LFGTRRAEWACKESAGNSQQYRQRDVRVSHG